MKHSFCSFLISTILQIWLFTTGSLVFAQNLPGRWVDDLYLITCHHPAKESHQTFFVDEKNNIHKEIPDITESLDLTVPNDYFKYHTIYPKWYNGALYTQAHRWGDKEKDGEKYCYEHFAKFEDDKWNYLGEFKTKPENSIYIIPCANDRFIVVSNKIDLANDNRPDRTPFARASFSSGSKELRIDSSIDHGQDELRKYMSNEIFFYMAHASTVVMTDEYAVLIQERTGLYWIFSLEKASLVKAGNIFKKVTPEMIAKGGFPEPILCVNPEKSGTILLSSIEEEYFLTEPDDVDQEMYELTQNNPNISPQEWMDIYKRRLDEVRARNPYVIWYRIYPENGKIEKLYEPPEGGTSIREKGKYDYWRPMSDGSVRMGYLALELSKKLERESQEADPKDDSNVAEDKRETSHVVATSSKTDTPSSSCTAVIF